MLKLRNGMRIVRIEAFNAALIVVKFMVQLKKAFPRRIEMNSYYMYYSIDIHSYINVT